MGVIVGVVDTVGKGVDVGVVDAVGVRVVPVGVSIVFLVVEELQLLINL